MRQPARNATHLNGALLKALISNRFGSNAELQNAWHARFADIEARNDGVPDRTTISRWRSGDWPNGRTGWLRLSSLLDIDPLALLDMSGDIRGVIKRIYRSYQQQVWNPKAFSLLSDFLGHKEEWPPQYVAKEYYDRDWIIREFPHDLTLGENFYVLVSLNGATNVFANRPQIFHFAYRHKELFGEWWVHYGYVARYKKFVQLISINGHVESYEAKEELAPAHVRTWFGPSPTVFRVASLHDFSIDISRREVEQYVHFPM